jgi:hypothetical protein
VGGGSTGSAECNAADSTTVIGGAGDRKRIERIKPIRTFPTGDSGLLKKIPQAHCCLGVTWNC